MSTATSKLSIDSTGSTRIPSVAFVFLFGTGSVYTVDDSTRWQHYVQARVPFEVIDSSSMKVDTNVEHVSAEIENIRETLGLSVSELARVLDVSRQAIYKWLAGKARPESDKLERLAHLRLIVDDFSEAGVTSVAALVRMRAFDGRSLLDLLSSRTFNHGHVQQLIDEGHAMAAAGARSGLRLGRGRPTKDWQNTFGIPGGLEEDAS